MTETITTLRTEDVYPNERHYREVRDEAVGRLADNMEVAGQLEPIRVWRDGDIYYIDAGHHRHAAAVKLGWETIDAIVQDADNLTAMVASNMHVPESELERSRGAQLLLTTGVRPVDAAKLVGEHHDKLTHAGAALKAINDPVAAEDLTLDRLAAIHEFADDADAVTAILNASEAEWKRIHDQFVRVRKTEHAVALAVKIVHDAGCELVPESVLNPVEGLRYLQRGMTPPEGATHGRVTSMSWNASAEVVWFGAIDAEAASEEQAIADAERQQREALAAAHDAAHGRRTAHVVAYLHGDSPGSSNALRDFAMAAWGDGVAADATMLTDAHDALTGDFARIYASILAAVESAARRVLHLHDWYIANDGDLTLRYFDALEACGYESVEVEQPALEAIVQALGGRE